MNNVNYIEYDQEEYNELLAGLLSLKEQSSNDIHDSCNNLKSLFDSMSPQKYNGDITIIENSIQSRTDKINDLVGNIMLSLTAYDSCDIELKALVDKYIVDALFSDEYDDILLNKYQDILGGAKKTLAYVELDASDYERMGFTKKQVDDFLSKYTDLTEKLAIFNALKYNRPDNYEDFNFNPGALLHDYTYYGMSKNALDKYDFQSELIEINGFQVEIVQVLPKNCNEIELLLYNYTKANTINLLKTYPDSFLGCVEELNNAIVLACDPNGYMDRDVGYALGFTCQTGPAKGVIVLDAKGSFYDSKIWIDDNLTHELGHKFDLVYDGSSELYSSNAGYEEWNGYRVKYKNKVANIVPGGYSAYSLDADHVYEFYAECIQAYFLKPDELKRLCPEIYDAITLQLENSS